MEGICKEADKKTILEAIDRKVAKIKAVLKVFFEEENIKVLLVAAEKIQGTNADARKQLIEALKVKCGAWKVQPADEVLKGDVVEACGDFDWVIEIYKEY